jgi:hypothetical protein
VRLELNQLRIHRPKERWRLYFVIVADHPDNRDLLLVTVMPGSPMLVVPEQHNTVNFEPAGEGTEGLLLLSRTLPPNREVNVHFYVMHSRRAAREIGTILQQIKEDAGKEAVGIISEAMGITAPWLKIGREGLPLIGRALGALPDRQLGFISMFERFGPEFERQVEVDRESRGGHISAVYTWSAVV